MFNKPIIINSTRLVKLLTFNKAIGIVLFPFIIVKNNAKPSLVNHEMIHFQQIKDYGVFGFYFNYLKEYRELKKYYKDLDYEPIEINRRSYKNISFESEAFDNQSNLSYLENRAKFANKKYKIF